jgi:hypothetical protein
MQSKIIIVLIFVNASVLYSQTENDSLIFWNQNRLLNWSDFKGEKDTLNFPGKAAVSYLSRIHIRNFDLDSDEPIFEVKTIFFRNKSFYVDTSELLLEHEQVHFNIEELYTRKMRLAIANLTVDELSDNKIYVKLSDSISSQCDKLHELYDFETNYGKNRIEQIKWNIKITQELKLVDQDLNASLENSIVGLFCQQKRSHERRKQVCRNHYIKS